MTRANPLTSCLRAVHHACLRWISRLGKGLARGGPGLQRYHGLVQAGWNAFRSGEYREAYLRFFSAEECLPGTLEVLEGRGWAAWRLGRELGEGEPLEDAARCFEVILERDAAHPGALRGLACVRKTQYGELSRAWRAIHDGDIAGALERFQRLAGQPRGLLPAGERWRLHAGLATSLELLMRHAEARETWMSMLRNDPQRGEALAGLARCAFHLRDIEEARGGLARALEVLPEAHDLKSLQAWCDYLEGEHARALEGFEATLSGQPLLADAHYGRGWSLLRLGESSRSLDAFRDALRLTALHPTLGELIAVLESGKEPEALELLGEIGWALYRDREYARAEQLAGSTWSEGLQGPSMRILRGACMIARGAGGAALEVLEPLSGADCEEIEARTWIVDAESGRRALISNNLESLMAWAHLAGGNLDGAAALFHRALEKRPGWANLWFGLGRVQARLGRSEEAARSLLRARELDPEDRQIIKELDELREVTWRDFHDGFERRELPALELTSSLRLARHGELRQAHAWLALECGDARAAVEILETDESEEARLLRAEALLKLERTEEAFALWEELSRATRSSVQGVLLGARALAASGRIRASNRVLRRALRRCSDHADLWVQMGMNASAAGKDARARRCILRALHLVPDHPEALGRAMVEGV